MADVTVCRLIDRLGLSRLSEGGFGAKLYTHHRGSLLLGVTRYVLVTSSSQVRLHLHSHDQCWNFLEGNEARQLVLLPDGGWHCHLLGHASEGKRGVSIVPGGCWQAVRTSGWALFSVFGQPSVPTLWDGSLASNWACEEIREFGGRE